MAQIEDFHDFIFEDPLSQILWILVARRMVACGDGITSNFNAWKPHSYWLYE